MEFRLIQTKVLNRPGVLNKITQTILRPGYNIEQISLSHIKEQNAAIMIFGINFEDLNSAKQMVKNLNQLVDVIKAVDITD